MSHPYREPGKPAAADMFSDAPMDLLSREIIGAGRAGLWVRSITLSMADALRLERDLHLSSMSRRFDLYSDEVYYQTRWERRSEEEIRKAAEDGPFLHYLGKPVYLGDHSAIETEPR